MNPSGERFPEEQRDAALEALSRKLDKVGILLSMCLDDQFPPNLGWSYHETGLYHASELWFRMQGWKIWDGTPNPPPTARAAWLVRCGSMKAPPPDRAR
jgi:hypothetical protein